MAGYNWQAGMSNNAIAAYSDGKLPASKMAAAIRKEFGVPGLTAADIRQYMQPCEWHHTSKRFNRTSFYDLGDVDDELVEELREAVATRKRNRKGGLQADVEMPLLNFSECGLPGNECIVRLKNGQLAAAGRVDFEWAPARSLTDAEYAAACKAWNLGELKGERA